MKAVNTPTTLAEHVVAAIRAVVGTGPVVLHGRLNWSDWTILFSSMAHLMRP